MFLDDVIGGISDFVGDAIGGIGGALDSIGIPLVGDALGAVGGAIGGLGNMVGGVAGGISDMFFSPLSSLTDIAGSLFGGMTGGIEASVMQPFPMGIPLLDTAIGNVGSAFGANSGVSGIVNMLAGQMDSMYSNLESQISGLDPNSPTFQKDLNNLNLAMSQFTTMTELLSNIQKNLHDMSMAIVRNIKG